MHTNSGVANKAAYLMTDGGTFNGKTVTGLGITKAAKIWYKVNVDLLTSAGDYQNLYDALQSLVHRTWSAPPASPPPTAPR